MLSKAVLVKSHLSMPCSIRRSHEFRHCFKPRIIHMTAPLRSLPSKLPNRGSTTE